MVGRGRHASLGPRPSGSICSAALGSEMKPPARQPAILCRGNGPDVEPSLAIKALIYFGINRATSASASLFAATHVLLQGPAAGQTASRPPPRSDTSRTNSRKSPQGVVNGVADADRQPCLARHADLAAIVEERHEPGRNVLCLPEMPRGSAVGQAAPGDVTCG